MQPLHRRARRLRAAVALAGFCAILAATSSRDLAQAAVAPASPVLLAHGWELARDPADRGLGEGWGNGGGGATWGPVTVPHVVEAQPLEQHFGGTVAWYRATFTGPPSGAWGLRFEQARRTARVWLNGLEIGSHEDPYTPFELEARGLRQGQLNSLVVRVDNRKGPEPREGWWNWGGLIRPVWLAPRGDVVLRELGLLSRVVGCPRCRATVLVDGELTSHWSRAVAPQIDVELRAPRGTVSRRTLNVAPIPAGGRARVAGAVPVQGAPALWWPHRPERYRVTVRVRSNGAVVQEQRLRTGLRSVTVTKGRLRLNGRALQLRGASIQEDSPGRGAALTAAEQDWIAHELPAINADVTRAHYPLDERLLDRFDKLGILVWSQAPIYHRDDLLRRPEERAKAIATVRGAVLATRNHPSVITHSVANELSPYPNSRPATAAFLNEARRLARRLDPTLPASVDLLGYPGVPRQRAYASFDLLGVNAYFGWYARRDRSTARITDLAPYLRRLHRQYPRAGLVLTEFGAEAIAPGSVRVKGTYGFQVRYLRRVLQTVDRLPFLSGAIYWTLREFAVKPRWYGGGEPPGVPRDGIHNKALVTYDGRRKPAWHVARRLFARTPLFVRPASRRR